MTKQRVVFRNLQSGRAFERIYHRDGSYVLVADRGTHERALRKAGAKLRETIEENRKEAATGDRYRAVPGR